jgi:hypothetical protein
MYVTKRAVAVNFVENDSVYITEKIDGYGKGEPNYPSV